jgi:ligand-binding sensor domain-containing protein
MRRRIGWAAGVAALVCIAWALTAMWSAAVVLRSSKREQAGRSRIPFRELTPGKQNMRRVFEPVGTPASFTDAALLNRRIHISGDTGLYVYDASGRLIAQYRAGQELPPAPLVAIAAAGAELFIASSGAGLLIYDGHDFRQIVPDGHYAKMTAVLPLSTGGALTGTERKGVLWWDGHELRPFHELLKDFYVTALAGDESDLWIGTLDRGVLRWKGGRLEQPQSPDPRILSLAAREGVVYAGTPIGVAEYRDGQFVRVLASGAFAQALHARGETLLIGTLEEGVLEMHGRGMRRWEGTDTRRFLELGGEIVALSPDGLYVQGKGRVLGVEGAALGDRNISALAVDARGQLWAGYFDRGLEVLGGPSLENDVAFCINRIVPDAEGKNVAVATANGLLILDIEGRQRQVLRRAEGLISNHVADVAWDGNGGLVAATSAGLTFLDSAGARSIYAFHGLANNHVYTLHLARGRLFAGTLGGLSILEGDVIRANYTTANSRLKHNWITAFQPLADSWLVGTYGAGVLKLDSAGGWQPSSVAAEVNQNAMASSAGRVYAGLLGKGLAVYNTALERWTYLTEGLPSLNVTAVAAGGGYVYVGTDNGLVRARESELPVE